MPQEKNAGLSRRVIMKSRVSTECAVVSRITVCIVVMAVLSGWTQAADWPGYRGPNCDGISSETGWRSTWTEPPTVAWKASLGAGFASMAVCNNRVYATGNVSDNDIVYCFDAATGEEIWKQSYPSPLNPKNHEGGPCATPTVEGDAVYVFGKNGDALRLNASTGKIVWHRNVVKELGLKPPTWFFSSSPVIVDDLVILNAGSSGLALNKADGSVGWKSGSDVAGYATAVPFTVGGKKCIALFGRRDLFGIEAATGKVLWRREWRTSYDINAADPIVAGERIFISSGYNKGCALLTLSADGVKEVYSNRNMRNQCNCSVLWDGYVYGFDGQVGGSGKLTCVDLSSGDVRWSQGGLGTGSLMLADGKLIVLGEAGKLAIVEASPAEYKELASAEILKGKCWTVPVLANGRIYARNAAGDLVCVDVRDEG
jgi:outer membrane protein assembly factor BamB